MANETESKGGKTGAEQKMPTVNVVIKRTKNLIAFGRCPPG